jgi:hypothetical protein
VLAIQPAPGGVRLPGRRRGYTRAAGAAGQRARVWRRGHAHAILPGGLLLPRPAAAQSVPGGALLPGGLAATHALPHADSVRGGHGDAHAQVCVRAAAHHAHLAERSSATRPTVLPAHSPRQIQRCAGDFTLSKRRCGSYIVPNDDVGHTHRRFRSSSFRRCGSQIIDLFPERPREAHRLIDEEYRLYDVYWSCTPSTFLSASKLAKALILSVSPGVRAQHPASTAPHSAHGVLVPISRW